MIDNNHGTLQCWNSFWPFAETCANWDIRVASIGVSASRPHPNACIPLWDEAVCEHTFVCGACKGDLTEPESDSIVPQETKHHQTQASEFRNDSRCFRIQNYWKIGKMSSNQIRKLDTLPDTSNVWDASRVIQVQRHFEAALFVFIMWPQLSDAPSVMTGNQQDTRTNIYMYMCVSPPKIHL